MFDIFDSSSTVFRGAVLTQGYTDNMGEWVPENTQYLEITGNVESMGDSDLQYIEQGIIEKGVMLFKTSEILNTGDRLIIDGVTWQVLKLMYNYRLIQKLTGISRAKYCIYKP